MLLNRSGSVDTLRQCVTATALLTLRDLTADTGAAAEVAATAGGVPWWMSGLKGTLLRALANVSVTVNNVVVKYLAPRSVATLTCTRLATFTADLGESALTEV